MKNGMTLNAVCILALTFVPLSVLGSGALLVEISIPQEIGRRECYDILYIESTLCHYPGINVVLARKAFDTEKNILVLELQDISHWSSLASELSKQGYHLSVTPLQTCSEYAKELLVDVEYPAANISKHVVLNYIKVLFYDKGKDTDDYIDVLKEHFRLDESAMENMTLDVACYRVYGNLPVKLIYFEPFISGSEMFMQEQTLRVAGKVSADISHLQSFQSYFETFHNTDSRLPCHDSVFWCKDEYIMPIPMLSELI